MGAESTRQIALLEGMISQQRTKVEALARRLCPRVTTEDLLNPHDIPELARDMHFNYEDGHLNGLQAALAALRAGHDSTQQ